MIISYNALLLIAVILGCIISFCLIAAGFYYLDNPEEDDDLEFGKVALRLGQFVGLSMVVLVALAGCTDNRDRIETAAQAAVSLPKMSDSELTCADEPSAPAPRGGAAKIRESQLTDYILDIREAGADCRDKLGVVRRVWRKVEETKSRAVPPANMGEPK